MTIDNTLQELMEYGNFSHKEVEYFSQNLSLKPLNIMMNRLLQKSLKRNMFVLDAGCGIGLFAFLTYSDQDEIPQPAFSTVGVDIVHKRLKLANILLRHNSKTHFVRSSIDYLPFKDKAFHAVLVHDVFCYPLSYHLVISEIARVTDGIIYFDVPSRFFYTIFPFLKPNPSYVTYELSDIIKELLSLSFEVVETIPAPLLYLSRKPRLPKQIVRLFNSFLALMPLRPNFCKLWPLVILGAQRYTSRKD